MENFTPLTATFGGLLIGLATVALMLLHGRIAGISGIVSGLLFGAPGDRAWRLSFALGLLLAPLLYSALAGRAPRFELEANFPLLIAGGLLVGFGTRLGSGCTSGHGVCGLARLSPRSLVSVLLFMTAGMVTVAVLRFALGA